MDELTYYIVMQPLGNAQVSNSALDILIDGQVQIRKQLHLANKTEVAVLGKVFEQKPELAKVLHQVSIFDEGGQHLAAPIEAERSAIIIRPVVSQSSTTGSSL